MRVEPLHLQGLLLYPQQTYPLVWLWLREDTVCEVCCGGCGDLRCCDLDLCEAACLYAVLLLI